MKMKMKQRLFRIATLFLMITIVGLGCEREPDWSSNSSLGKYLSEKLSKENSGRDCNVDVSTFEGKCRLVTIWLKSGDGYSMNALKKLKTGGPYEVMVHGSVKAVPNLSQTQILSLLLDSKDNGELKADLSKLAETDNLQNLTLREVTRKVFDGLPTLQVMKCSIDFAENMSLTSADLLKFPKLKSLSVGSMNAMLTIKPERLEKWPPLTSLIFWGNCIGYEPLLDLPGLEQLFFINTKIAPGITPEKLAHLKSVFFDNCTFSSPSQQQEIEKLSNVKILPKNNL